MNKDPVPTVSTAHPSYASITGLPRVRRRSLVTQPSTSQDFLSLQCLVENPAARCPPMSRVLPNPYEADQLPVLQIA